MATIGRARRSASLVNKLIVLVAVFIALPMIAYPILKSSDNGKRGLVLLLVQKHGKLVAKNLRPLLADRDQTTVGPIKKRLADVADGDFRVKLFYQPAWMTDPREAFHPAAFPTVPQAYRRDDRAALIRAGIFSELPVACDGGSLLARGYINPSGKSETVASITGIPAAGGCWLVIASYPTEGLIGSAIEAPYWQNVEVLATMLIYLLASGLVVYLFLSVWRSLRRFERLARDIRNDYASNSSFTRLNEVPELRGVAQEFDTLVRTLQSSAQSVRHAAEDNSHAFKTPLAIIRQSLEPLRRSIPKSNSRARRALELIETSTIRLDGLVSAARRMDEVNAQIIDQPRQIINVSELLQRILSGYAAALQQNGLNLNHRLERNVTVRGSEEMLETIVENLLDNAVSISPLEGGITVALRSDGNDAELSVEDDGPGVDPRYLSKMFERYFSNRETSDAAEEEERAAGDNPDQHSGIGLWIVRRNVEAIGGYVTAENLPERGLGVRVVLPLAS